ncbi:MAG: hypothetical protein FADNKDHG_01298 [Holosporales bacterium]
MTFVVQNEILVVVVVQYLLFVVQVDLFLIHELLQALLYIHDPYDLLILAERLMEISHHAQYRFVLV